jgi:AraC family transcriptional regulator
MTGFSPSTFQEQQQMIGSDLSVQIVERVATTVYCVRHDGPIATIPHTYRHLYQTCEDARLALDCVTVVGISHGNPDQPSEFHYRAGVVLAGNMDGVPGLERWEIPGGRYAAYRLSGAYALIAATFQRLFGHWLPQSGLEPDDRPVLEIYHDDPNRPTGLAPCTDLLIPVREEIA